jgi:predicted RNA-binding protein YlxR (DUF448 family)
MKAPERPRLRAKAGPKARARRRRATTDAGTPAEDLPDADEGDAPERGPLRRCIVTRERLAKERMIRFVVLPADPAAGRKLAQVVPDLAATLPGRGIWLSAVGDVIETARTRGAFARAARCPVSVSPDLTSDLEAALARRVVETLGLARRAGQAVGGFGKAREWLVGGRAGLVVQASDGSPEERQRFLGGWKDRVPVVAPLDAVRLGGVFGRDHAVHVVLLPGRLAERVHSDSERLEGVRSARPAAAKAPPPDTLGRHAGRNDAPGAAGGMVTGTGG